MKIKGVDILVNVLMALLIIGVWIAAIIFAVTLWIDVIFDFDFVFLIAAILITILALLPAGFVVDEIQKSKSISETIKVEVEVIDKKYTPPRTNMVYSGKVLVPVRVAAKYEIMIKDNSHDKTVNNKDIYEQFEVGDKFEMNKTIYKNKKGDDIYANIIDNDFYAYN